MQLKEIKTGDILANFYQPRTKFDRENIKELSESILSNGLINPITVTPDKKRKGKFMIVSGERRWQAHRVAEIKTIPCVVKEYKTDVQFMVESLIENIHREDLSPKEKGKFASKIMKEDFLSIPETAKKISIAEDTLRSWFDEIKIRKDFRKTLGPRVEQLSSSVIRETKTLPIEQREHLLKEAIKEDFGSREMRKRVSEIKAEERPEPVKFERTADDVVDDILSNLHDFKYNVNQLLKEMNIEDLSKSKAGKAITTAGLHLKHFKDFVNTLRQRGAKPDKFILALIRANGKV